MSRVVVAGSNKVIEPVIEKLHELNLLHVVNYSGTDDAFEMGKPLGTASEYAEKLIKLRSIERYLNISDKMPHKQFPESQVLSQMDGILGSVGDDVIATAERISEIDNEVKIKQDQAKALKPLAGLPLDLELLYGYNSLAPFVGTVASPVEADVSKVSYVNEVFTASSGGTNAVAVFVPAEKAGDVSGVLAEHGFSEISVPRGLTGSIAGAISTLESDSKRLEGEKVPLQKKLNDIKAQHEDLTLAIDEYLSIQSQKAESPLRFASTDNAFMIDGWLPTDQYETLKRELESAAGGRVQVEKLDGSEADKLVETGEDIPTKMNNPSIVRPYELITRLFAIPEYKEFDPTLLIFVFFPLMFGLILGDVAYGLIIFIVMFMLKRKFRTPGWASLINIVIIASIWAIIFGFIFGEIFGPLGLWDYIFSGSHHVGLLGTVADPHHVGIDFGSGFYGSLGRLGPEIGGFAGGMFPMYRLATASVLMLIGVSIFIGVIHTGIGSVLGVKNELAYGEKRHAYFEKLPVLLFQVFFGLGLLGLIAGGLTHPLVLLSALVIIISIVMMVKGPEGVMGATHIPFFVSNLISYLRLLAIGLASVGVAFAANQLAFYVLMPMLSGGGHEGFTTIAIVVGIVVLIMVHFINLLLGILSPFMHPLRLHYVEMFTKFYSGHGGGVEYSPFGRVRRFLRD
ncbi:MAG: V-type ATP synthase subunit I [Methanothrix sp.]|nr:V-type ATP synthase subunit I [Methanothrix sp.]